ncbi:enediyne antibiotic chromoprotein [Streptomyces tirandamycinicus]|uniref:enediyne antibiotic chromoprotein n=1 Tax=Streptomyces TaxID=1883 RepID=UPI00036010A3|nr:MULTISPECIES: enediyne antibiotic chromoprotein [Streptomyces]MCY0983689.1 enediyne antibiotic chromoprotein [Streptomyces tirandamycinicus]NNJ08551.1 macromomycin [Streptomyces sp. PKU-MA01144]
MTVKNKLGLATRITAATAVAAGLALAVQPSALAAATAPVVSVSPASGLTDGQQVTVTATGLTPNTVFHLGHCAFVEPEKYGCDATTAKDVVSDASGKVNTTITVHSSFEAVVTSDGAVWGTVDAKKTQTQVGLGSDAGEGGGQPVTFK